RRRRLAGAGFADQAETLALRDIEADGIHRTYRATGDAVRHVEISDFEAHRQASARRRRGLAISSRPAVSRNRPTNRMIRIAIGSMIHQHKPNMNAGWFIDQMFALA